MMLQEFDFLQFAFRDERLAGDPDAWLKQKCGIVSKSELDRDRSACEKFEIIESHFKAWRLARAHGQLER
jgi:hypothetical protein